jgi:hypothetical protein
MRRDGVFEELWETAPRAIEVFDPGRVSGLPPAAQRYLRHTLTPGARLSTSARIRMHGTIRLGNGWSPFEVEKVLRWDRGFIWRAKTRIHGLPVVGSDRWVDGEGSMRLKQLGVVPIVTGEGPDISRSAAGRLHIESMWLPAVLLGDDVRWSQRDAAPPEATVSAHGEASRLELVVGPDGAPHTAVMPRWGNPGGEASHPVDFGAAVDEERTFSGITVPTRLRIGWYFGSERFERDGEFIWVTVDDIAFR